jgi:hypothetical protein
MKRKPFASSYKAEWIKYVPLSTFLILPTEFIYEFLLIHHCRLFSQSRRDLRPYEIYAASTGKSLRDVWGKSAGHIFKN